ncbi:MAG: hypothetical protein ACYDA9_05135 [Terriglobia bacterium]
MKKEPIIDNLRNHSAETVGKLRDLLIAGAPARLDPRRKNFYELENCSKIYYIHLSPGNGKVMLLAVWDKDAGDETNAEKISEALLACSGTC